MPTLSEKWKRKRTTIGHMGGSSLASLETLTSEDGETFGAKLSAALDKFFEKSEDDQEGRIKPG